MTAALVWGNILAWSLQVGLVAGLGALMLIALPIRVPRARLLYWQILLAACLALPWIGRSLGNWRQQVVTAATQLSANPVAAGVAGEASTALHRTISIPQIALTLLFAGILLRFGFLTFGLGRLAAYRRRGRELPRNLRIPGIPIRATLLLSDDVTGPVTFGWRNPVVLLPPCFPSLGDEMRDAILCHELLHVARRDWLFAIAEELLRVALWFHPAIWWVLGEIRLSREQTVDHAVVETTMRREAYVDALLLMAGTADPHHLAPHNYTPIDLAPAPMFLRRRQLKRRLIEVMKEVSMNTISKTRLACAMSVALVGVAAAGWLATAVFPLSAAPQIVSDAVGVAVNTNGSQLIHRSSVPYPAEALAKSVEGAVVVQVKLDANGEVSDAAVLSGPDDLRRGVLQSVLNWHFEKNEALTTRTINIDFVKPAKKPAAVFSPSVANASSSASTSATVDRIIVTGLSDHATSELISALPVHEGDNWTPGTPAAVAEAAKIFDSHLATTFSRNRNGGFEIRIAVPNTGPSAAILTAASRLSGPFAASGSAGRLQFTAAQPPVFAAQPQPAALQPQAGVYSVGNGVTAPMVLSKVDPQYSEEARAAKFDGSVTLSVVIGTYGRAESIQVVHGVGMGLDEKAVEAVQQWVFRPGANQGVPVKVRAQIAVNFRML